MKMNFIRYFVATTILFVGFGCAPTEQLTSNIFTYSDVQVGQQYGAMTVGKVSSNNDSPISADNIQVEFTGMVTLIGTLAAPTGNPEDGGMGPDYSLQALTTDSLKKMPFQETDERSVWFGIRNPEIIEAANIKNGDRVELTINRYYYILFPAGVWNSADAISVKKINDAPQTVPTEPADENLTSYNNDQLKISFSYPKEWGMAELKEASISPEARTGTIFYISFSEAVNSYPLISYSTLDFQKTGDGDVAPLIDWQALDFNKSEIELAGLFPNENAITRKLMVNGKQILKVNRDYTEPLTQERITPLDYFIPNVVIGGTKNNLHIVGSPEQEADLDKLLASLTF